MSDALYAQLALGIVGSSKSRDRTRQLYGRDQLGPARHFVDGSAIS
jgi:hypothetical protein